jgi:catechol 2,3-dioxygenase-like lactoylglutathione lyase family enzyme
MKALRLLHISLNIADLASAEQFYTQALGFTAATASSTSHAQLASLIRVRTIQTLRLSRGNQTLELTQIDPPGAPYPPQSQSNDLWFQHCALATDNMADAYARLRNHAFTAISRHGPQTLPGGIIAFKFRDPEGHPLELIQFPHPNQATAGGIDHCAIAVADAARSIAFYDSTLGLSVAAQQLNTGPAQDALDNLDGASVDVVALVPKDPSPHVELLGYRTPPGRPAPRANWNDIAATRLVFSTESVLHQANDVRLLEDPDGHKIIVEGAAA